MKYSYVLFLIVGIIAASTLSQPCKVVLRHLSSDITTFASSYWHDQDALFNNGRANAWNTSQYLSAVTIFVDKYYSADATFYLPPYVNISGRNNLIAGFTYAISPINGGELRFNNGDIMSCEDFTHFTIIRDTLTIALPLNDTTHLPYGSMNFILSTSRMDLEISRGSDDLKITFIHSDQRGLYFLSSLVSPLTGAISPWTPTIL